MTVEEATDRLMSLVNKVAAERFEFDLSYPFYSNEKKEGTLRASVLYIEQVVQHRLNEIAAARHDETSHRQGQHDAGR